MFKFSISSTSGKKYSDFYHDNENLGLRGMTSFLDWLSLNGIDLKLPDIHLLLKNGSVGEYKMSISQCSTVDDLTSYW